MRVCISSGDMSLLDCPYRVAGTDVRLLVAYTSGDVRAFSYRLGSFSVLKDLLYERLCSDASISSVDVMTYREDCILSIYRSKK